MYSLEWSHLENLNQIYFAMSSVGKVVAMLHRWLIKYERKFWRNILKTYRELLNLRECCTCVCCMLHVAFAHSAQTLDACNHKRILQMRTVHLETASIHTFDLCTLLPAQSIHFVAIGRFQYGKLHLNVFSYQSPPESSKLDQSN